MVFHKLECVFYNKGGIKTNSFKYGQLSLVYTDLIISIGDTCSEVDNDIYEEDGIWKAIEGNPSGAEVVVEEGDGHGQDDQIGHQ